MNTPAAPASPEPRHPSRFRPIPIVATIVVALAVALMIALGVWQLQRGAEKEALLRQVAANQSLPPTAFPNPAQGDQWLFRRAGAYCLRPIAWQIDGGRTAAGGSGWRRIARCATGAEGPGFLVQLGLSDAPQGNPTWRGGPVSGYITRAPSHTPLIARVFSHEPDMLMLVADRPLPGLTANPGPDLNSVPNNHLAYAVQWFLFAAVAAIIYAIALRRRWQKHRDRYSHPGPHRHKLPDDPASGSSGGVAGRGGTP